MADHRQARGDVRRNSQDGLILSDCYILSGVIFGKRIQSANEVTASPMTPALPQITRRLLLVWLERRWGWSKSRLMRNGSGALCLQLIKVLLGNP